uniref:Uncharacterized protein n=1 Tax=Parascaris univalens TaxID=6257 RepID=A0A914ZQ54_PARUN
SYSPPKCNTKTLSGFVPHILNFAVLNHDPTITRLVCDIIAASMTDQSQLQLLRLLYARREELPVVLTVGSGSSVFQINVNKGTLHIRLIGLTFEIHARMLRSTCTALSVDVEEWLEIARNVIPMDPFIHDAVFSWMRSMVLCGGYSLQPLYRRLLSMIECGHPSIAYYNFIETFAAHLSIPDQLVKSLLSSMRYPLCKQKYGEGYADAISSMLMRQSYLLKEDDMREVEAKIAAELSELPHSIPATRILKTLLILDTRRPPVELTQSLFSRLKRTHESSLETEVRWCWALSGMVARLQTESTFFSESPVDTNSEQQCIPLQSGHSATATEANIPPSENQPHPQANVNGIKTVIIGDEETTTSYTISEGSRGCSQTLTEDRHNVRAACSSRNEGETFGNEWTDVPSCSSRTPDVVSRSPMHGGSEPRMNKTTDGTICRDGDDSDSVVLISDDEDVPPKRSKTDEKGKEKEKSPHIVSKTSVESVDDILAIFES